VFKSKVFLKRGQPFESWYGYSAALKQFDLYDISIPIGELKNYLIANYGARLSVHPQRFEEVVASVFSNIGYSARVTGCSGDGGIDVILDGPDGSVIGVQVKRSKNTIEVEQIRSLAGALIIKGITRGIFVTTSSFRAGAPRTARLCSLAGIPIELIDAQRFYEALKLSQSKIDEEPEQTWPPEKLPQLQFINSYRMNSL
jgi:restriction system protein